MSWIRVERVSMTFSGASAKSISGKVRQYQREGTVMWALWQRPYLLGISSPKLPKSVLLNVLFPQKSGWIWTSVQETFEPSLPVTTVVSLKQSGWYETDYPGSHIPMSISVWLCFDINASLLWNINISQTSSASMTNIEWRWVSQDIQRQQPKEVKKLLYSSTKPSLLMIMISHGSWSFLVLSSI